LIPCGVAIPQKLGIDEEIFVVDLKKGEVTKGLSFHSCTMLTVGVWISILNGLLLNFRTVSREAGCYLLLHG
jgi:hypothetical protein